MQRYDGQLINQFPNAISGNAAAGAQVTVRLKSSGAIVTLYATDSLSGGTLDNPLTADAKGFYSFYAPDGVYTLDVSLSGTPQLEIQLQDVASLQSQFNNAVSNAGYIPVGTFSAGCTVSQSNGVVSDGVSYWRWDGALPKTVTAGSAPVPTGVGGWFIVSDYGFRDALAQNASTQLISGKKAKFIDTVYPSVAELKASNITENGTFVRLGDTGLVYEITNNPESVPSFASSLMVNSDETTFIKLNNGTHWARIVVSSGADYVKSKWPELYGRAMHKLRIKSACKIACFGDSITFGQGTVGKADSVNRIGQATNFGDGSTYNNWQLITPYPAYLQAFLRTMYGDSNIQVYNRGYSGDSVYQVVKRHITPTGADFGLLMIGINDCAYATSNHTNQTGVITTTGYNLDAFRLGLQQVLIRETMRGVAMILMTCESQASNTGFDGTTNSGNVLTEAYNDVIRSVGIAYGVPVIETIKDLFANYPIFPRVVSGGGEQLGLTHDGVHLDPYGAEILAARLACIFGGKGVNLSQPKPVSGGCKMLPSYAQDSVVSPAALMASSADSYAPFFLSQTNPQSINLATGQTAYYCFYTDQDDVIAHPAGKVSNGGVVTFTLDFGVQQPEFTLDVPAGQKKLGNGVGSRPVSAVTIEGSASMQTFSKRGSIRKGLHIATRGWHVIAVQAAAGTCELYGLQFTQQDAMTATSQFVQEFQLAATLNNSTQVTVYTSTEDYEQIIVDVRADVGGSKRWVKAQLTKVGTTYSASYIVSSSNLRVEWSGNDVVLFNDTAGSMLVNFTSIYIYRV